MKLFANIDENGRCLSFGEYAGVPENGFPLVELPLALDGLADNPRRYEVLNGKLVKNATYSVEVDAEIEADAITDAETRSQAEYIAQLEASLLEVEEALNG